MPEELLVLLVVGVVLWALVELLQTDGAAVRVLPKWAWAVLIVTLPPLGAVAWFLLGRPQLAATGRPAPASPLRRRQAWVARPAPDDDPEFLALLNARADQQRRLRRLEEDFRSGGDGQEPESDRPE